MMCLVVATLLSLAAPQDVPPQDDTAKKLEELTKRIEALEREKADLQKQVENLERFSLEAAEMISRLKKMIANGGSRGGVPADAPPVARDTHSSDPGPTTPVHGKILTVVPEHRFLIVGLGEDDGVKEGWVFEVIRTVRDGDGKPPRHELLGKAEFEKFVASARSTQSKLKIIDGDPEKMKYGDSVVANRKMEPLPQPKEGGEPGVKPEARKFKIVGMTGDTYFVNAGSQDNLKQSDKLFVYRDKRAIAQLRVDRVDKDNSTAKIIDGTRTAEIAQGDEVQLKDLKTSIVGKVKRIETKGDATGAWIEVGQSQGVKMGMHFEVRRQSKVIGRLVVKTLSNWHSVCEAVAPMTLDDLQTDDFIESVD
ncbi:MAG TPA: hypothetical protein VFC90_01665 [Planctomycetota bacterium]|nr:hypothetical protein [Planctomycetota bacterium]